MTSIEISFGSPQVTSTALWPGTDLRPSDYRAEATALPSTGTMTPAVATSSVTVELDPSSTAFPLTNRYPGTTTTLEALSAAGVTTGVAVAVVVSSGTAHAAAVASLSMVPA